MPAFVISLIMLFIMAGGPQSITCVFLVRWEEKRGTFSFDIDVIWTYSLLTGNTDIAHVCRPDLSTPLRFAQDDTG